MSFTDRLARLLRPERNLVFRLLLDAELTVPDVVDVPRSPTAGPAALPPSTAGHESGT